MTNPNIITILADDMGYGDLRANCPDSAIPTPNLDRLAARGMRFTDAHATTAVCTPSRYALLTGRYSWRSRLQNEIVWPYDGALIEPDRPTVASLLRKHGYATTCIGKWHLGWDWPTHDGRHPNETLTFGRPEGADRFAFGEKQIDFSGRIGGGPVDRGFDYYFGVDVPNFPPYTWFVDDRLDPLPDTTKPQEMYGLPGPMVEGWSLEAMIPRFTEKAVRTIEAATNTPDSKPFFLYLPLTSPHSPIVPNAQFQGKSGIGGYGDFVCEVDWVVGEIMDALDRTGQAGNTLLIFTSDNGPEQKTRDDEGVYARAERTGHYSMGPLRGIKRDAWEGGHRVPFVAAWPKVIPPGRVCDQLIGLVDLFATCREIVSAPSLGDAAEDSLSILPLLRGECETRVREELVYHSSSGKFALRTADWVFIDANSGGENEEPEWFQKQRGYEAHDDPGELYHLRDDLIERENRYADENERVNTMRTRLATLLGERAGSTEGLTTPPEA